MAENKKLTEFLLRAGDAAAINVSGYVWKTVDTYMNTRPYFSSVATVNSGGATGAANAKWKKSALYTGLGLAVDAGMDFFTKEDETEGLGLVARYATDFAYGLSAANIAADPVIQAFPPTFQGAANATAQTTAIRRSNIVGAMG